MRAMVGVAIVTGLRRSELFALRWKDIDGERQTPTGARFDDFVTRYNTVRPHQAPAMKVPADFYARSSHASIAAYRS